MEPRAPRPAGRFATRAVHAGTHVPQVEQEGVAGAIWPAVAWGVQRSSELADLLADRAEGYVYGRYDDPTSTALNLQVATLHEAEAAWSLSSGTAAIHATLDVLRGDGRILATDRLYGGTWALLQRLARDSGWEVDHADLRSPEAVEQALSGEHTVLYAETIANPSTSVADLARLASIAEEAGTHLVVDNTFASPWLCRPLSLGATVVVESATKYLGGHGDAVAGVVAGPEDVIARVREATYEFGGSLGPFTAWLVSRGMQTLPLRLRQSSRSALAVARALSEAGAEVAYPGLESHPEHRLAAAQFGDRGFGGVLAVDLGGRAAAEAFADACRVFLRAVSLGASRSLVLHPASTSHRQLDDGALRAAGLGPGTVRMSCGIEDTEDLVADVRRAWAQARDTTGGSS